jgi:hypothetical protein
MKKLLLAIGGGLAALGLSAVMAATTVVVTPSNPQGWSTADTRPGGTVQIVPETLTGGNGSLRLTTDATTAAKAQYLHAANTPIGSVTELSYSTQQNSGPVHAAASYQFIVDLNGAAAGGFTTFVYEPYQNGTVLPAVWQNWDVDAGQMWSSRNFSEGSCVVVAGGGGAPFYTLAGLKLTCPNAVVIGFGVNIGTFNPSYDVETDFVNFNGTTYDFEMFQPATDKDQCKDGGWMTRTRGDGSTFKNQGDCVSFTNNGR